MTSPEAKQPARKLTWLCSRSAVLVLGTLLAVLLIAVLSRWDIRRRHAELLEDFGQHQERLARSLATNLEALLAASGGDPRVRLAAALTRLQKLEERGRWVILLWAPGTPGFVTLSGQPMDQEFLREAMHSGLGSERLHRDMAAKLGLPKRAAIAGVARFRIDPAQECWIAVVATAAWARDREETASWRALLAVLVAACAVLVQGGIALHRQRQELRVQQALAVEEARNRREAELERASRAATLGTLAMGITHELSTPLSIIAARAEQLITRLSSDERGLRSAQVIKEQSIRMGQVIRGILGLVRNQAPSAERLSPLAICRGAMNLVGHRFLATNTKLRLEIVSNGRLPSVRGEQRLLEQALVNLLLNACDACPASGQVVLRVSAFAQQVCFRVADNGVGISAEAAARAMEPFFTTKPIGQGTGLGLAITHEIVKSHRGSLHIRPLPEGGTCAEILLPQAEETNSHGD